MGVSTQSVSKINKTKKQSSDTTRSRVNPATLASFVKNSFPIEPVAQNNFQSTLLGSRSRITQRFPDYLL